MQVDQLSFDPRPSISNDGWLLRTLRAAAQSRPLTISQELLMAERFIRHLRRLSFIFDGDYESAAGV